MITLEELLPLLSQPENQRVEKTISRTNTDKWGEAICAFANDLAQTTLPGYLVIGVDDDGTWQWDTVSEELLQALLDFRTDGRIVPPISLQVSRFRLENKEVAVCEVHPHPQPPIRYKGAIYVRNGAQRIKANELEERILIEKRTSSQSHYDIWPCREAQLEDLKTARFTEDYLPKAIDRETLEANHRDLVLQLSSLKLYDTRLGCPTMAGVLAFGKQPRHFIPGAYIQYVRFQGEDVTSPDVAESRLEGDLLSLFELATLFIDTQLITRHLPALGKDYETDYPASALKELLYNAIVHRDYQSHAPHQALSLPESYRD